MTAKVWLRSSIAAALLAVASVASAQQAVSSTDIQRLQDQVYQASSDVTRLRSTDSAQATRLETELDDLRDEVVYLKVKLRKDGTVSRSEYGDLRDKIQTLRSRARGDATSQSEWGRTDDRTSALRAAAAVSSGTSSGGYDNTRPSTQSSQSSRSAIPVGQEIDVRLQTRAHVRHRAGRGSLRGDDRRRSLPRQRGADSRRLDHARRRQLGEPGVADRPEGQSDRGLRSGHRQRPQLPDARHRDAGARERRHQG